MAPSRRAGPHNSCPPWCPGCPLVLVGRHDLPTVRRCPPNRQAPPQPSWAGFAWLDMSARTSGPFAGPRTDSRRLSPSRNAGLTATTTLAWPVWPTGPHARFPAHERPDPHRTTHHQVRLTRRWGPAQIASLLGLVTSTVHRIPTLYALARLSHADRPTSTCSPAAPTPIRTMPSPQSSRP
jgi:hypothetical protein